MDMLAAAAIGQPGEEFPQAQAGFQPPPVDPGGPGGPTGVNGANGSAENQPQLTGKQTSARSIRPGCGIEAEKVKSGWPGGAALKPGLLELREELLRRWQSNDSSQTVVPNSWTTVQIAEKLLLLAPPEGTAATQKAAEKTAEKKSGGIKSKKKKVNKNDKPNDNDDESSVSSCVAV